MKKDKEWYLAWQPGDSGYARDDVILAVGMKSCAASLSLRDAISWLGAPDKAWGNAKSGTLAYYFENQQETFASFDVVDGEIRNFGTMARRRDNARRTDAATGAETPFNVLDLMDNYAGSEMAKSIESVLPGGAPGAAAIG